MSVSHAEKSAKFSSAYDVGTAVFCLAAIFWIPYFVPQSPVASDSYLFGFNNRAAVVLVILGAALVAIWRKGSSLQLKPAGEAAKVPHRVLWGCLLFQAAVCLSMIFVADDFGGFFESNYGIGRLHLLANGKQPYTGFEWPFGVLMLYVPLWAAKVMHCSLANAYYAVWFSASLGGVALLFATINLFDYPTRKKTSIFLILFFCLGGSAIGMGLHYTLVRYVAPLYMILLVMRAGMQGARAQLSALLAVGFTAALLLLSPEMAVAHAFACGVLLFPHKTGISPCAAPLRVYVFMLAAMVALFGVAYRLQLLQTLLASGAGADSFPIPIALPILYFFAVVLICACSLFLRIRDASKNDNTVAPILLSIPLLVAALGRCDPGHLLCNGLGMFLAMFLYASSDELMWRQWRNWFVFAMWLVPSITGRIVWPVIERAAMQTAAMSVMPGATGLRTDLVRAAIAVVPAWRSEGAMDRLHQSQRQVVPRTIDFAAIYPSVDLAGAGHILQAPFGYVPNGFGSYHAGDVDYGFYDALENANTPGAVGRKIDELKAHPDRALLVPGGRDLCGSHEEVERQLIDNIFLTLYLAPVAHPVSVHAPLCDFILIHYRLSRAATTENYGYALWLPG